MQSPMRRFWIGWMKTTTWLIKPTVVGCCIGLGESVFGLCETRMSRDSGVEQNHGSQVQCRILRAHQKESDSVVHPVSLGNQSKATTTVNDVSEPSGLLYSPYGIVPVPFLV